MCVMSLYQFAHMLLNYQALNDHSCVNVSNYNLPYSNLFNFHPNLSPTKRLHEFSVNYRKNKYGRI